MAPANTLASFDTALEGGADMIEFDVRPCRGDLVLSHMPVMRRACLTLEEALEHLCRPAFAHVGLNVDLKTPGRENAVLAALHRHGAADRALITSQLPGVITRVREQDPSVRTAVSVGGAIARRARRWSVRGWRSVLVHALASGRFGDVMLHHRLVDEPLMAAVDGVGRRVYAWTVEDPAIYARLADLGVAGVVTGNPSALRRPVQAVGA